MLPSGPIYSIGGNRTIVAASPEMSQPKLILDRIDKHRDDPQRQLAIDHSFVKPRQMIGSNRRTTREIKTSTKLWRIDDHIDVIRNR